MQAFQPSKIILRGHLPERIKGGIYCEQWEVYRGFYSHRRRD